MNFENKKRAILMPLLFAGLISTGLLLGKYLQKNTEQGQFFAYPQMNKLDALIDYIEQEYVDSVSRDSLIELAIPQILKNLDPHSVYIPASDLEEMIEPLEGNFDGIGVQFNIQNDTVMVVNTISGGPSEKVGVQAGDRIVKVNDSNIAGIKIANDAVIKKLKGPRGTKVKIGIIRKNVKNILNFTVVRDKIPLYSVDAAYMINKDIGYIKISKFARTTHDEFVKAIAKLRPLGLKKIILDLRENGGGYMDAATNIADEFLSKGKLIVYTKGKARPKTSTFATEKGYCENDEVVVLIDEWSASASEIVAGALQDNDRGTIIGRRSFGKGLVQEPTEFNDGSSIRLTIARYYTPTGRCIQKPYTHNTDDYYYELGKRYLNGEFSKVDSLQFADSLKFKTPKGKTVYGGGGIMPDIFVPIDTLGYSTYFSEINNAGLIYRFAFKYVDVNRKQLIVYQNYKQLTAYLEKVNIFNQFIDFAEKEGIKKNQKEIAISKQIIKTQVNAFICRNVLEDDGFYPVIQEIDATLKKAVNILK